MEDGCCRMAREGQGSRLGTGFRFVWLISINKSDVNSELWKICARKNDFLKPQLVAWQRGRNDRTFVLTSLLTSFNGAFKRGTESQRVSAGPWNLKSVGGALHVQIWGSSACRPCSCTCSCSWPTLGSDRSPGWKLGCFLWWPWTPDPLWDAGSRAGLWRVIRLVGNKFPRFPPFATTCQLISAA